MVIALMGLFIFTIGHVYVRPYDAFVHDKLELLSLAVSQITLFVGLLANFYKEDQKSDKRTMTEIEANNLNQYFGAVIVLVNGIFVLYFALNLIFHVYFFMPSVVRSRLNRCCPCICRRCKQCQDMHDNVHEKIYGDSRRNSFKRKYMSDYNSEGGREMHKTHSSVDAYHQEMVKVKFVVQMGCAGTKNPCEYARWPPNVCNYPRLAKPGTTIMLWSQGGPVSLELCDKSYARAAGDKLPSKTGRIILTKEKIWATRSQMKMMWAMKMKKMDLGLS